MKIKGIIVSIFAISSLGFNFYLSTPIRGLKETYHLIFVHPPLAWVAYLLFTLSSLYGAFFLYKKDSLYAIKSYVMMSVGYVFIIYAAFSGMAWGQLYWGDIGMSNQDPRFVSIIFVLIMYSAYFLLRKSGKDKDSVQKLSSVYTLICLPFATFFIFLMPRIKTSLHPNNPIFSKNQSSMEYSFGLENLLILGFSFITTLLLANFFYTFRYRIELLTQEKESKYE